MSMAKKNKTHPRIPQTYHGNLRVTTPQCHISPSLEIRPKLRPGHSPSLSHFSPKKGRLFPHKGNASKLPFLGFPKIGEFPPKWMVKIMEKPWWKNGWFGENPLFSGNIHIFAWSLTSPIKLGIPFSTTPKKTCRSSLTSWHPMCCSWRML